jgi:hypothetical protein
MDYFDLDFNLRISEWQFAKSTVTWRVAHRAMTCQRVSLPAPVVQVLPALALQMYIMHICLHQRFPTGVPRTLPRGTVRCKVHPITGHQGPRGGVEV